MALAFSFNASSAESSSSTTPRTIVIGDLHGDLEAFLSILSDRKLIDANANWIGQNINLILLGDYHDRGPDSRYLMDYFLQLKSEMIKDKSRLVSVIGNHELMTAMSDLRYVTESELESFSGFQSPIGKQKLDNDLYEKKMQTAQETATQAFAPVVELEDGRKVRVKLPPKKRSEVEGYVAAHFGNNKYTNFINNSEAMLKMNGNLFVHAGITEWVFQFSMKEVNKIVKSWMTFFQGLSPKPDDSTQWAIEESGPLWDRTMATNELDEDLVGEIVKKLGVKRIIVGHTPKEKIETLYDGKVLTIDTGNSKFYNGVISLIEIDSKDKISEYYVPRKKASSQLYNKLVCQFRTEQNKSCQREIK